MSEYHAYTVRVIGVTTHEDESGPYTVRHASLRLPFPSFCLPPSSNGRLLPSDGHLCSLILWFPSQFASIHLHGRSDFRVPHETARNLPLLVLSPSDVLDSDPFAPLLVCSHRVRLGLHPPCGFQQV